MKTPNSRMIDAYCSALNSEELHDSTLAEPKDWSDSERRSIEKRWNRRRCAVLYLAGGYPVGKHPELDTYVTNIVREW